MTNDRFGIKKIYETKPNGETWFARWEKSRTLTQNDYDPYDARVMVTCDSPGLTIGNGIAQWTTFQNSGRIYIKGSWLNTEMTAYVKVLSSTDVDSIQLRSRSNHHGASDLPYADKGALPSGSTDISCGFGGYIVKWGENSGDNLLSIEREAIHGMYKRHLIDQTFVIPLNQYVGYKNITRTSGSNVIVEGWNNTSTTDFVNGWTKNIEYTFDGTNAAVDNSTLNDADGLARQAYCVNRGDNIGATLNASSTQSWLTPGYWTWLRMEEAQNIDIKFMSCREIDV